MNYLNGHYTSLRDLNDLDSDIKKLETKRTEAIEVVNSRFDGGNAPQVSVSDSLFKRLIEEVQTVCKEEDQAKIADLKLKYGNLQIFHKLETILKNKRETLKKIDQLERVQQLQNEIEAINAETEISVYESLYLEVDELSESYSQLKSQFMSKLNVLKEKLQTDLSRKLVEIRWLSKEGPKPFNIEELKLKQLIELQSTVGAPLYPDTWWAIDTLLEPFVMRFNYNFNTKKATNKISKPEWAFEYVSDFLEQNAEYLQLVVGDVLVPYGRISLYEIINSILVPVRKKMNSSLESILLSIEQNPEEEKNGRLLSHLIFELASFDQKLRSVYLYNPFVNTKETPSKKWTGLTGDILSNAVTAWLSFEESLTIRRFKEVLNESAWQIDFDFKGTEKPTFGAYDLCKLFENVTAHHQTISILKYQLKYVSRVQMNLLDLYTDELQKRFRTISSKTMRSYIPGNIEQKDTEQLPYLLNLCECYCSAKYLNYKMDSWSGELVFAQLWQAFIKISGEHQESTFFDVYKSKCDNIIIHSQDKIVDLLNSEARLFLKDYVNNSEWQIDVTHDVSLGLSAFISKFPSYLHELKRCIAITDYFVITAKILSFISTVLLEFVITNNRFSSAGRQQLRIDIDYIWKSIGQLLFVQNVDDENIFNHLDNAKYIKLQQSVEFLSSIESSESKLFTSQETYHLLRDKSSSRFDSLTDSDIFDLIHRVL